VSIILAYRNTFKNHFALQIAKNQGGFAKIQRFFKENGPITV
jgi:hypothetical protein